MAKDQNRRMHPRTIKQDRKALVALQKLSDYEPRNAAHRLQALSTLDAAAEEAQQAEIHAQNAVTAARKHVIASEWALHNAMLGVKSEIVVQYGVESAAIEALGLKRKSEHKRPRRVPTQDGGTIDRTPVA